MGYEQFREEIDGKTAGVVRASIGLVTTFADVYRFWEFARSFRDAEHDTAVRVHRSCPTPPPPVVPYRHGEDDPVPA